jgi:long-chain acyl-CoA synthetase
MANEGHCVSVLIELDQLRSALSAPGAPFELVDQAIGGIPLKTYRHLPANLSHLIVQAQEHAARIFLVSGERRLSYGETLGRAAALAVWLQAAGSGGRIAIAMRNSPEWVIAFLAIQLAGATAVLVNSRGTADEIRHALDDTGCTLLIADPRQAAGLAGGYQGSILIAEADGGFNTADGAAIDLAPAPLRISAAMLDDVAMILFTSGTTGRPKGAMLTHRGVASFLFGLRHSGAAYLASAAKRMGLEPQALAAGLPQMASLAIFPFFHVSGVSASLMTALTLGGKLVMMARWDPAEALALIAREGITNLQGPPSLFWDVLNCPGSAGANLGSIGILGIGGQATPPHLLAQLARHFPRAAPGGGYGMTETNGAIAAGTGAEYLANPQAAGRILPGVEIRIADAEGQALPFGEVGEIWVKGALVMAGYCNQPEANAASFCDGWFKTGDIGHLDQDRFITIVDRQKDVIIRGGENIYSAELERVFQHFPGVLEVAAFGVPDGRWGERVVLAVVPQPGAALDAEAMLGFGRTQLASYKLPSELVISPEPLVRNATGKVDKTALRRARAG